MANKSSGRRNRADKKMSKEEHDKLKRAETEKKMVLGMVGIFIVIIVIALAFRFTGPENTSDYSNPYEIVGDELLISMSDISKSAKYYSYESGGTNVKFFAVEGSDGQVHTAFDNMECRNCGKKYSTNQIGTANQSGGCWPGYMERTVSGDYVRIKLSELDGGNYYFR
jgi:hypothetical protein